MFDICSAAYREGENLREVLVYVSAWSMYSEMLCVIVQLSFCVWW